MQYHRIPHSSLEVSTLGLGTMTFGEQNSEADAHAQGPPPAGGLQPGRVSGGTAPDQQYYLCGGSNSRYCNRASA